MATPFPVCYLNGEFGPLGEARISPLDRGFLFADGVYEVLPVYGGRPFRFKEHFERLNRSLDQIRMSRPHGLRDWLAIVEEMVSRNGGGEMYVYVQVTRGAEVGRNHAFPRGVPPTIFAFAAPLPEITPEMVGRGISAITTEDVRWARCDIKSIALLPNVLSRQAAVDDEAREAILLRGQEVMEGASTSVLAMLNGVLVTRPDDQWILPGTTREAIIELAIENGIRVERRAIQIDELRRAAEIWTTAATMGALAVTRLDGKPVADGRPGPQWRKIHAAYESLKGKLKGTPAL